MRNEMFDGVEIQTIPTIFEIAQWVSEFGNISKVVFSAFVVFFSDAIVCRSAAKNFRLLLLVAFEHFSSSRLCWNKKGK